MQSYHGGCHKEIPWQQRSQPQHEENPPHAIISVMRREYFTDSDLQISVLVSWVLKQQNEEGFLKNYIIQSSLRRLTLSLPMCMCCCFFKLLARGDIFYHFHKNFMVM